MVAAAQPFGLRRYRRRTIISTSLPPEFFGVARSSNLLPGVNTLESETVAVTRSGSDHS